jgi:hypothetical protein
VDAPEPVVVFRSNDPDECGAVAGALSDQNVQAWIHDDVAAPFAATAWSGVLPWPACVSVRAVDRDQALAFIATMIPGARGQKREALDPIHGRGRAISPGWRALALLALAVLLVIGGIRVIEMLR